MVGNYQNADWFKKYIYCVVYYNFRTISFPIANVHTVGAEEMLRAPGDYT